MELITAGVTISGEHEFENEFRFEQDANVPLDIVFSKKTALRFHVKFFPITTREHVTMLLRRMFGMTYVEVPTHYCVVKNVRWPDGRSSNGVWIALLFDPIFGLNRQHGAPTSKLFAAMALHVSIALTNLEVKGLVVVKPRDHEIIRINTQFYLGWSLFFADKPTLPNEKFARIVVDSNEQAVTFYNPVYNNTMKSDYIGMVLRGISSNEEHIEYMATSFYVQSTDIPPGFVPYIFTCAILALWNQQNVINFPAVARSIREYYYNNLSEITPTQVIESSVTWHTDVFENVRVQRAEPRFLVQGQLPTNEPCNMSIGNTEEIGFYQKIAGFQDLEHAVHPALYYSAMKCERSFIGVVVLRNFGGVSITDAYIPESTPLDSIIATARQSIDVLKALHSRNLHHGAIAPENVRVYLYNDSIENVQLRNFFDWQGASERRDQFAPPELHQSRFMLGVEKIDVWALGVCIALALHRFNVLEVPQFVREFNPMMFTLEMREAVVESTDRLINELFALETQMDRVPLLAPWLRSMLAYNPNERSLPA